MESQLHAVGVDLAWGDGPPSGLAHFVGTSGVDGLSWRLSESASLVSVDAIAAWIGSRVPLHATAWVAVDAPLLARNPAGTQREADKQLARDFRPFRVGALPVDERMAVRGVALREKLAESGFDFAVPVEGTVTARGVFETYPTAATLGLFELQRPLPYKRGGTALRRDGLRSLQMRLALLDDAALRIADSNAWRTLLRADPAGLQGARLKDLEDRLDATLAALVAALAFSAPMRLATYGTIEDGFITVPHPPASAAPA